MIKLNEIWVWTLGNFYGGQIWTCVLLSQGIVKGVWSERLILFPSVLHVHLNKAPLLTTEKQKFENTRRYNLKGIKIRKKWCFPLRIHLYPNLKVLGPYLWVGAPFENSFFCFIPMACLLHIYSTCARDIQHIKKACKVEARCWKEGLVFWVLVSTWKLEARW